MKTIKVKSSQLTKVGGIDNPLPKVGDGISQSSSGKRGTIKAVRLIGKPYRGMHNGLYAGNIQKFEMDVTIQGE